MMKLFPVITKPMFIRTLESLIQLEIDQLWMKIWDLGHSVDILRQS